MVERKDWRNLSTLPVELKVTLGFTEDPQQKEWLIHDGIASVGGVDEIYESLPAIARVSRDGTRYEVGARREDVEGLLALARIIKLQAQDINWVKDFWRDHPKFSFKEEGGWIYVGTNMEPTPIGFETEYRPVMLAYDLAIEAAIGNLTYDEMKADKENGTWIDYVENPTQRTLLFSCLSDEISRGKESNHEIDPERIITSDNLREFPLATYKTAIHFAPGKLVQEGKQKILKDIYVCAHNGKPEVEIRGEDGLNMRLSIPEEVNIRTVDDLRKLKQAQLINDKGEPSSEMDVDIKVEDNAFHVVSSDGKFDLEVRTPACEDCKIPTWKFPWPQEDSAEMDFPLKKFRMHEVSTSLGIYRCNVGEKTYCFDCVSKLEEKYMHEHPFVMRSRAIDVARARLNNIGYTDVEIMEDQVWRTLAPGWEFQTKIVYERDGRRITRYTGAPTLSDEGEFNSNMFSREYVDFRYH